MINDAESARRPSSHGTPPAPQQTLEVENLIVQLTELLLDWDKNTTVRAMGTTEQEHLEPDRNCLFDEEEDHINILASGKRH